MAVNETTTVDEPAEVTPAAVEAEDKSEQDDDVELEDIEVTPEELGDETEEQSEEESEAKDESDESETEESAEETEEVVSDEDKQKAFNKQMAERRIQEKQQREQTQKQQQEEYLTQAEDDKDLALRQLQVDAYNNKVEANSNKLTNGYERAIKDFDILTSKSPEIQAEVDAAIDAFQAMYVTVDAYGNPTDVRGNLYAYLQSKADSIRQLTGIGARQQAKDKGKEKSKALTLPNRTPKEPKKDADLDAFDEEASKW